MKNLFPPIKKMLFFLCAFLLMGCQTPVQNPPTPTYFYRTPTPIPTSLSEENPVVKAFRRLEELNSYRLTITYMEGTENRIVYLLEKNGHGKFRVGFSDKPDTLVVNGQVYKKDSYEVWHIDSEYPRAKEENWWLILPTSDFGCSFDFIYQPPIYSEFYPSGLIPQKIVTYGEGNAHSNPGVQCELTIDKDGYPRRNLTEVLLEECIFVWQFTDFDGEDIAPIVAPTIK
jgi:hypothetical protein